MPRDLFKSLGPTLGVGALRLQFRSPRATPPATHPRPAGQSARSSSPSSPEAAAAQGTRHCPCSPNQRVAQQAGAGSAGGQERGLCPGIPEAERGGVQGEWGERRRK